MNPEPDKSCLNCDLPVLGKYCHHCGQMSTHEKITFRDTINQFLSASFSLQGPLLSTIKLLVVNPGKVFRDFIEGKRKSYYNPISFFVLLTAIYIIIRVIIGYDPLVGQFENNDHVEGSTFQNTSKEASRYMVNNINYIMIFLVFSIGLMLKLFFRKRYNLAEYTSVGFYISGIYVITGIIFMLAGNYFSFQMGQYQLLLLLVIIFYSTYSLFKRINFGLSLKYLLVSVFSLMLYIGLGFGFSLLIVSI